MEKKQTVYRKVMVKDRLPEFEGDAYHSTFITDDGVVGFDKTTGWEDYYDPEWWLEEVELIGAYESYDDIVKIPDLFDMTNIEAATAGANYILNKLK